MRPHFTKLMVRLPEEIKSFVEGEATRNASSQNSEIIRCIRERMEKRQTERTLAQTEEMKTAI